ncbi:ribokinase [Tritonibacter horizontis]|uniref:Ribokinase n=1 Tax=Tritonibacter horizontis TaxID=1768241 RepID=A0A132C251_9RHOB|nr:ribokinase [Tritonibacter horizontis]KUP94634.1 ribokinase [Tritonibacter horizontis]
MTVVVVGSINIDLTMYLDRWPGIGETLTARDSAVSLGGKGANQCVAATRLGAQTAMLGAIGDDSYGREAVAALQRAHITLGLKTVTESATGMACIDVGPEGDNMIRLAAGANATLSSADVREQAALFKDARVVLLQNETPLNAALEAARLGREAGACVIMDPAPVPVPVWETSVFAAFDILTPNAAEAEHILQTPLRSTQAALTGARALAAFARRGAILTMGGAGVAWCVDGSTGYLPAAAVKVVDTVAAGDCFNGALASGLAQGWDVATAIGFAVRAAALSASRKGAQISLPSRAEVEAFGTVALASENNSTV